MKKRCTPNNNAMHIHTDVECITPILTTNTCIDPLTYLFQTAVNTSVETGKSVEETIDLLLDKGIILSNTTHVCCPDCENAPLYALAGVQTFLILAQALGWTSSSVPNLAPYCCINIDANAEIYNMYYSAMKDDLNLPECCPTNFSNCINSLNTQLNIYTILETGIVEVNTLSSDTTLCKLFSLLQSVKNPAYLNGSYTEIIEGILQKGFVTYCCGCNMIIASVETFINYADSGACPDLVQN